jgi:hypothetical protein
MPGLVPGIHVLTALVDKKDVDGRDKPGHDEDLPKRDYRFNFQTAKQFQTRVYAPRRAAPESCIYLSPP